jgi:uncharacterized protein YndB with AHSA1/START domain
MKSTSKRSTKRSTGRSRKPSETGTIAGISSAAVENATGRGWREWLRVLDAAGARRMLHKEIAAYLHSEHSVPPWWSQMVTVGYEQARGMREKHQKSDGYSAGSSRTIGAPVSALYRAWHDGRTRSRWLGADLDVRKATPERSMRITWAGGTNVEVNFASKGAGKSHVSVQHGKLPSAREVARMKAFWTEALDRLKSTLEARASR